MKEPRYFFGDQQLWRTGRTHEIVRSRRTTQVYEGIDAADSEVLPASPNFLTEVTVHTFFDPYADTNGDYTRLSFRGCIDAMVEALVARSEKRAPVCYIDDVASASPSTTVSGVAGLVISTTMNPNRFAIGDVVLIRRNAVDQWTVSPLTARAAGSITITSATHVIQNGDSIHLVSQYWKNLVYQDKAGIGLDKDKNWFNDNATYKFQGRVPATSAYRRITINLDQ